MKQRRRRLRLVASLTPPSLLVWLAIQLPECSNRRPDQRHGPLHTLGSPSDPNGLTEELALKCAVRAMIEDGFSTNEWSPLPDGRSTAPNGKPDRFLVRNVHNPNRGVAAFPTNDFPVFNVQLERSGNEIAARRIRLKQKASSCPSSRRKDASKSSAPSPT